MKKERIFISSVAQDAAVTAREFGLGIELAQFCYARNLDKPPQERDQLVSDCLGFSHRIFHAPFAELSPAAIEPLVYSATKTRYLQTVELAKHYGCEKIVIHSGFVPLVYFPEWFEAQFVAFWRDFLQKADDIPTICIENVMETEPFMLAGAVRAVNDPRLRLCLDVGHANLGKDGLDAWLDAFLPELAHVHIHNNFGEKDTHNPIFDGNIDIKHILSRIEKETDATCTIEVQEAKSSVLWLKEQGITE